MDYSQFLYMREELSLLLVILILFVADLFMCPDKKSGKGTINTALPVVLLALHTIFNFMPAHTTDLSAFGGMYLYTPMMSIIKTILSIGTLIAFLLAHDWLKRPENAVKQGEFYILTLSTLLGMYLMISSLVKASKKLRSDAQKYGIPFIDTSVRYRETIQEFADGVVDLLSE